MKKPRVLCAFYEDVPDSTRAFVAEALKEHGWVMRPFSLARLEERVGGFRTANPPRAYAEIERRLGKVRAVIVLAMQELSYPLAVLRIAQTHGMPCMCILEIQQPFPEDFERKSLTIRVRSLSDDTELLAALDDFLDTT